VLIVAAEIAANAAQPWAATKNRIVHEGDEEHEAAFKNVFITRRGRSALCGSLG